MANSVDTLEAIFNNNECKLNLIMCKLESLLDCEQSDASSNTLNPVKILEEMKNIKKELAEVKQMYSDLQSYKKKIGEELKTESASIEKEINEFLQSFNKSD